MMDRNGKKRSFVTARVRLMNNRKAREVISILSGVCRFCGHSMAVHWSENEHSGAVIRSCCRGNECRCVFREPQWEPVG